MAWDFSSGQRQALGEFLSDLGVTRGPVTTRRIGDGHSNLTFLVDDGERQVVVRRPPPPPTPPGAHDVVREATVIAALAGTPVAVPEVFGRCPAGEVLDVAFYVMGYVPGPIITTSTPDLFAEPVQRRALAESLVDTLAALHDVDWRAHGLGDFGRPEGFNARHLSRIARLVADDSGAPPREFAAIDTWLREHVPPESGAAIVHNDFRIGNIVIAPDRPGRVAAVLDWELATVGDPLLDLAYFLASYPAAGEPSTPTTEFGTALLEPGYPSREELRHRYGVARGIELPSLDWYAATVQWKLAVLYEYGRRRAASDTGDAYYADPEHVRRFLRAAHTAAGLEPPSERESR